MIRNIAIADCVHHCGFRYGRDEFNPYENYIRGLATGQSLHELRAQFVNFIQHYRPRDVGEALGVATSRSIPLWHLPWKSWRALSSPSGWQNSPSGVVDLLGYFCPQGIEWHRIEEEFSWLENAYSSITQRGYQPQHYSYIEVFELRSEADSRFLIIDGNHRLCALHAMGKKQVQVRQRILRKAHRKFARLWPLVLTRHVSYEDALKIFDAYFHGNPVPVRSQSPSPIIKREY